MLALHLTVLYTFITIFNELDFLSHGYIYLTNHYSIKCSDGITQIVISVLECAVTITKKKLCSYLFETIFLIQRIFKIVDLIERHFFPPVLLQFAKVQRFLNIRSLPHPFFSPTAS